MNSVRTIAVTSFVALALCIATFPANAANRVVNGDFETCDLTGWSFAPSEVSEGFPLTGVYNGGINGCSFFTFDQAKIFQTFEVVAGETFAVTFQAELIPLISDLNQAWIISDPCEPEDGGDDPMYGRVGIEWLHAEPGYQPNQTLGGVPFEVRAGGPQGGTAGPAPAGTTHARVTVASCAAIGGVIYDDIVVDTA